MMKREVLFFFFSAGQMSIRRSLSLVGRMPSRRPATLFVLAAVVMTTLFFLGLAAKPAHASTFTVNSTADTYFDGCEVGDSGDCTLREAITDANNNNNDSTVDVINFNIPSSRDPNCDATTHVCTISPGSSLPEISEPVLINGYSQPEASPNTLATGSNAVLKIELYGGLAGTFGADGLVIRAPNVVVKGLIIDGWSRDAVAIKDPTTTNTRIEGNFIGTDATGLQNTGNGGSGVYVLGTPSTVIGGTSAGARNVISGNTYGVTAQATNTTIEGNLIGTDKIGSGRLGNSQFGVWLYYAKDAVIGGTTSEARNVISGNGGIGGGTGVYIYGSGATNNTIEGNYIGTDASGVQEKGNSAGGVVIEDAPGNVVGGTSAGARNVISGNGGGGMGGGIGVGVRGSGATNNIIEGNYIGIDASGVQKKGNHSSGVAIFNAPSNVVGGTSAGARNTISNNGRAGVDVSGSGATDNTIEGNYIGTDASGTAPLSGNPLAGVFIAAPSNVVGGTSAGARNTISGNDFYGVTIASDTGNRILGNSIFGNGGLGINLRGGTESVYGVTQNDLGAPPDTDTGSNNLQNLPDISSAKPTKKKKKKLTTITGTLNSTPNRTFTVQFFSSPLPDASGFGEGKTFAGELTNVITNSAGDASFSIRVARSKAPVGSFVTATATDNSTGDTSEFSQVCPVGSSAC